jgi:hypothetical protein
VAAIIGDDADIVYQYGIGTLTRVSEPPINLDDSIFNKVSLIKNRIKKSLRKLKIGDFC